MSLRTLVPTLLLAFTFPAIAQDYKTTILPKLNGLNTVGFAMNASGQIVGSAPVPTGGHRNFIWSRQAGMVDIGEPEFGPWRVNSAGTIAGSESVGGNSHAFIRTPEGAFQDLGTLGGNWSESIGINDQGQVAGCSDTATSPPYVQDVFFWTAISASRSDGINSASSLSCSRRCGITVSAFSTNQATLSRSPHPQSVSWSAIATASWRAVAPHRYDA